MPCAIKNSSLNALRSLFQLQWLICKRIAIKTLPLTFLKWSVLINLPLLICFSSLLPTSKEKTPKSAKTSKAMSPKRYKLKPKDFSLTKIKKTRSKSYKLLRSKFKRTNSPKNHSQFSRRLTTKVPLDTCTKFGHFSSGITQIKSSNFLIRIANNLTYYSITYATLLSATYWPK